MIKGYNIATKTEFASWSIPALIENQQETAACKAIIFSPGEEVFLAVRKDGELFLCN